MREGWFQRQTVILLTDHKLKSMSDCRPLDADQAASYNPPSFARISGGQFTSVTTSPALFRLAARFDDVGFSDIVNIRNRVMELRAGGATVYQFEGGEPYM